MATQPERTTKTRAVTAVRSLGARACRNSVTIGLPSVCRTRTRTGTYVLHVCFSITVRKNGVSVMFNFYGICYCKIMGY